MTTLNCSRNHLTELDVSSCSGLNTLYCYNNQLTKLEISNCGNLIGLRCDDNQLTDLTIFSKLTNCQWLDLDNNPLTGSLVSLQDLSRLTMLHLEHTNIREGLEYLPASLKKIYCSGSLAKRLIDYSESYNLYNYQTWRKDHQYLIEIVPKKLELEEWENILTRLLKYESKYYDITNSSTIRKGLFSPDDGFQLWVGEKISKLKAQIREYYLKKIIDFYDVFSSEK